MIEDLPNYIPLVFGCTTFATLFLFILTIRKSKANETRKQALPVLLALMLWLIIQALLTLNNVYSLDTNSFPPKIALLGILPTVLIIALLFLTARGKQFIDSLPLQNLTYLHIVRLPVELVLFWLFLHQAVPQLMTFEGRNFDILAGLTAPIVIYFGFIKSNINRRLILLWNFICLGLLINIVVNAFLSAPSPVQKFAFEQPNIAILNFPFSWLPTFIVPIILFGHLASIRQLLKNS